ncbi:iron-containing redox enzyme family protein [Pigmentiphaga soli]|uniref:Iron-containing redox enzyme family protein n=2 Tax=Pigmentiphaga soli TaxID=1007095 RepID=A0ABP8GF34_9BURK
MLKDALEVVRLSPAPMPEAPLQGPAQALYDALSHGAPNAGLLARARNFLNVRLQEVHDRPSDMPDDLRECAAWMEGKAMRVGRLYADYLAARRRGGPCRYFTSRAHALYFLRSIAPTKLVDGAWLYGLVDHWDDTRFHPLIRIYLEELGDGVPDRNHVAMYRKLLAASGCGRWDDLEDDRYVQGTIQLALAYDSEHYLPEIIGFNLGYEQLPLHLLITAYELDDLGIDPYYFTLHVTIDNLATGHARKAIDALRLAMPAGSDAQAFYRRVIDGYLLNDLGAGTESIIRAFDLERELVRILRRKSVFGRHMHSDYCRVAGKSVNEWLADEALIPEFLAQLQRHGWIRRHRDPNDSPFWKLLVGDRAAMFGVFDEYELQIVHDWIAGDAGRGDADRFGSEPERETRRRMSFRARQTLLGGEETRTADDAADAGDFDAPVRALQAALVGRRTRRERMTMLAPLLSPARHASPEGLLATRLFSEELRSSY